MSGVRRCPAQQRSMSVGSRVYETDVGSQAAMINETVFGGEANGPL